MTRLESFGCSAVTLVVGVSAMGLAQADSLTDPTRPATEWLAAQPVAPGSQPAVSSAALEVQVLVIGHSRKFAIIDGQLVRLGEAVNGAKLVAFHADGVVLQKDGNKEKLSMTPAVVKKLEGSKPVVGRAKSGKKVVNGEGQ